MNLLELARTAARVFVEHAYPRDAPEVAQAKIEQLGGMEREQDLIDWAQLEKEGDKHFLRLGNSRYPHMKLAFVLEGGRPVFYVDAHDSHFIVSPTTPGYEKLLELRDFNKQLKHSIESSLDRAGVPVFGRQKQPIVHHKICLGMTVLAIDDEPQILDMLYIIVASLGAHLWRAKSAAEGRAAIAKNGPPDVILCDIMMREESGYDFVAWLKKQEIDTPVYYLTGLNREQVEEEGVLDVLQKPFSAKSVMSILKKHYQPKPPQDQRAAG